MDKTLQVFISSTYSELKEERQAAVQAILKAGHIPAGMELSTAGDRSQMETIKRWKELRREVRKGLNSGPSEPWDAGAMKKKARAR